MERKALIMKDETFWVEHPEEKREEGTYIYIPQEDKFYKQQRHILYAISNWGECGCHAVGRNENEAIDYARYHCRNAKLLSSMQTTCEFSCIPITSIGNKKIFVMEE